MAAMDKKAPWASWVYRAYRKGVVAGLWNDMKKMAMYVAASEMAIKDAINEIRPLPLDRMEVISRVTDTPITDGVLKTNEYKNQVRITVCPYCANGVDPNNKCCGEKCDRCGFNPCVAIARVTRLRAHDMAEKEVEITAGDTIGRYTVKYLNLRAGV